ncbi:hypothetical protein [Mycobacterium asiaticum]|uniref:hypothetical protein n=1 Tax=Mycobacterium asiaticum TaxID=1790 RepID=UPI0007EDC4E7|nr:hypothetical protein [Mycobacterium asiaticum]
MDGRPNVEMCSWRQGVGIVDNIRRDGNRVWFSYARPGEPPEDLWLAPEFFDHRLCDGDWADVKTVGEGPPEPEWMHSELWRVVPPRDEPPAETVHIEPAHVYVAGVMATVHLGHGHSFSRFRDDDHYQRRGEWHLPTAYPRARFTDDRQWSDAGGPPMPDQVETLLDLLYSAWRLARYIAQHSPELFETQTR